MVDTECQYCGSREYQESSWSSIYICLDCGEYFEGDYELEELRRQRKLYREKQSPDEWE